MVGTGESYRRHGVPVTGAPNLLPSEGFATIDRRLMWQDIRAGWIGTHWRQLRCALRMRRQYRLAVAVGDMVPVGAAILASTPFLFVGCAKSAYYNRAGAYSPFEKWLLRRYCLRSYPRDALTVKEFERAGVPCSTAGNPMMDGLDDKGQALLSEEREIIVGVLPGSRLDATQNTLDLLCLLREVPAWIPGRKVRLLFAAHDGFDLDRFEEMFGASQSTTTWGIVRSNRPASLPSDSLLLEHSQHMDAVVRKGRFAAILHASHIVVGMAGTANEQAIGLGKPLIALPSRGVQGEHYARMKQDYFGPAAITAPRDAHEIAKTIASVFANPSLRAEMAAAGRERMGGPGASEAIARDILDILSTGAGQRGEN